MTVFGRTIAPRSITLLWALFCFIRCITAQEAVARAPSATPSPPSNVIANVSTTHETHCFPDNSARTYGIIDNDACDEVIQRLWKRNKLIRLDSDDGIAASYEIRGQNCRIDIYGGSKDSVVRERVLAEIASDIIHGNCKHSGRGGVSPIGADEFFLSIESKPLHGTDTVSGVPQDASEAPALNSSATERTVCYGQSHAKINQPACAKLVGKLFKDTRRPTLKPKSRREWEEGLGECNIVLNVGAVPDIMSTRDIAQVALAVLRGCKALGRGGKAYIGQRGSTVEIQTILEHHTSNPLSDATLNSSRVPAPVPLSSPGSTPINCYENYFPINRYACRRVLQSMDRLPRLGNYQPDQNQKWGDQYCEVWLFAGDKAIEVWSSTVMKAAKELLSDCAFRGHGGVKNMGIAGCEVAIMSRQIDYRFSVTSGRPFQNNTSASLDSQMSIAKS